MSRFPFLSALAAGWVFCASAPIAAQEPQQAISLSAAELFAFADAARDAEDYETAEAAYRALTDNPDLEMRSEARFRLAMMLADRLERYSDAAVLFRQILDEQPDAARVRVELARMQVAMGNYQAADRELRAAQASGLPPEVEAIVRFYSNALNARKPFGGSIQLAFAPDTNINRATTSDTLGTILGDFDLNDDAQAKSGVGLAVRGQGYYRQGVEPGIDLLLRASGLGRIYRDSEFDDYLLALQAGPEYRMGQDRLSLAATLNWRWYGQDHYTTSYGLSGNYRHPMGERTRMTVDVTALYTDDRLNDLRDNHRLSASVGVDRAFSARFGGGLRASSSRQMAVDPGYSTASGGVDAYAYREFGQTTLVANIGYDHLEADKRLFLYPQRRVDDRIELGLSGTFRALRVGSFAPLASIKFEDSHSTIEIYDYQRIAVEMGVTAAF